MHLPLFFPLALSDLERFAAVQRKLLPQRPLELSDALRGHPTRSSPATCPHPNTRQHRHPRDNSKYDFHTAKKPTHYAMDLRSE